MGRILQERRRLIYASSSAGRMSSKAFLHRPPSRGNRWSLLETGHLQSGGFADLQGTVGGGGLLQAALGHGALDRVMKEPEVFANTGHCLVL